METNTEVISDLNGLINVVKDGKEGYESAAETTDRIELKAVFLKYAAQRSGYEALNEIETYHHRLANE